MQIDIIGRKYEVSNKLNDLILKKLSKFEKYFKDDTVVTVICKQESAEILSMELTIKLKDGTIIRSLKSSNNMYENLDCVLPKIEGQLRKHKTKLEKKLKLDAYTDVASYDSKNEDVIIRKKVFDLPKISVDEAITQLDLIDNSFYVFLNEGTNKVSIIYKRQNRGIGQIDCEY